MQPADSQEKHPGTQPLQDESSRAANWRDEVASRVNSYRARRKGGNRHHPSPALDFGPDEFASKESANGFTDNASTNYDAQPLDAARIPVSLNPAPTNVGPKNNNIDPGDYAPPTAARAPAARRPARNAFDTNYYRRLNAESMAQAPALLTGATLTGATTAATASALEMDFASSHTGEPDVEGWIMNGVPNDVSNKAPNDAIPAATTAAPDLQLHPALADDSVLDRYCISQPEPTPPEPESPELSSQTSPQATSQRSSQAPLPGAPSGEIPSWAVPSASSPAQGNLIVFRRPLLEPPLLPQPSRDELAEPVNRRPRILEVPEDIMPAVQGSLFPEIRLDADVPENQGIPEPAIETPLRVASLRQRLAASLTDLGVVLSAGVLFAAIACFALPGIPHAKPFWMILFAVTILLWAIYQHLFLLFARRTVGMSLRGIHLRTFDGHTPPWEQRRRRAHFMCMSFVSVGLGFVWALVDEDALCWHDRVSQTFPTTE
jgi:uncharacterized RDD family membrane protein YckC